MHKIFGIKENCKYFDREGAYLIVYQNGKVHKQLFKRGIPQGNLNIVGDTVTTGTTITFMPDYEIFETLNFDYSELKSRFREIAFLNKGLKLSIEDRRGEEEQKEVYHFEGGIVEFVEYLNKNKEVMFEKPVYVDVVNKNNEVEIAF
jgi:DNA gyrase subunit B